MIRKKYKEFYEFVELNCPELCKLWEECNDRPVPIIGQILKMVQHFSIFLLGMIPDRRFQLEVLVLYIIKIN